MCPSCRRGEAVPRITVVVMIGVSLVMDGVPEGVQAGEEGRWEGCRVRSDGEGLVIRRARGRA